MKKFRSLIGATALCSSFASFALAATDGTSSDSQIRLDLTPPAAVKPVSGQQAYLFDLSGLGKPLGKTLASHGIYFMGTTNVQPISVVSGGLEHGTYVYSVSIFGMGLDMQKLAGIKGGKFFFAATLQAGQTSSTGTHPTASSIFNHVNFGDEARLFEFAWEQSFAQDRVKFLFGRLANPLSTYAGGFGAFPWLCSFATQSCGNPGLFAADGSKNGYNMSSWGGAVFLQPTKAVTFKMGVYEDVGLENTEANQNGWPGADWGLNESSGAYIPAQLEYKASFGPGHLPGQYFAGGYYDTVTITDPYYNSNGKPLSAYGGTAMHHKGSTGFWIMGDQTVYQDQQRSLALFGAMEYGSPYQPIEQEFEGGLMLKGLLPSRPLDSLNFIAETAELNGRLVEEEDVKLKTGHMPRNTQSFELNYSALIAPGVTVRPYVQYIKNPDEYGYASQRPIANTVNIGAELIVNFNRLLGMPQLDL